MKKILQPPMLCTNCVGVQSMQILRLPEVSRLTGLPRSTIYLYIKNNQFPKQIKLGARSVGWVSGEIERWLHARATLREV